MKHNNPFLKCCLSHWNQGSGGNFVKFPVYDEWNGLRTRSRLKVVLTSWVACWRTVWRTDWRVSLWLMFAKEMNCFYCCWLACLPATQVEKYPNSGPLFHPCVCKLTKLVSHDDDAFRSWDLFAGFITLKPTHLDTAMHKLICTTYKVGWVVCYTFFLVRLCLEIGH